MSKTKIYFAHTTRQKHSRRKRKIIKILIKRGYEVFDPLLGQPMKTEDISVVDKDLELLDFCDSIFCWFPKKHNTNIGTGGEFMYSHMKGKKEIIALHYQAHIFLMRFATKFYKSFRDFKKDKTYIKR